MKLAFVVVALLVVQAVTGESFEEWKKKQSKDYEGEKSASEAEKNYKASQDEADNHNKAGDSTYKKGTNDASDMTPEEKAKRKGVKVSGKEGRKSNKEGTKPTGAGAHPTGAGGKGTTKSPLTTKDGRKVKSKLPNRVRGTPPASFTHVPNMTPVKNQAKCGCDWADTSASILEFWSKKNKTNKIFSEQSLIDCVTDADGCNGGDSVSALFFVQSNGISDGTKYKFTGKTGKCQMKTYQSVYKLKDVCGDIIDGDENIMKQIIAGYGPMIAYIQTNGTGFDTYKSGIYSDKKCSNDPEEADTAVLIVGYGTDTKLGDFWIIQNSYGTTWGEKGFMRMKRGKNMCGIANYYISPC